MLHHHHHGKYFHLLKYCIFDRSNIKGKGLLTLFTYIRMIWYEEEAKFKCKVLRFLKLLSFAPKVLYTYTTWIPSNPIPLIAYGATFILDVFFLDKGCLAVNVLKFIVVSISLITKNAFFLSEICISLSEWQRGIGVTRPAARRQPERLFGQAATPSLARPFPFWDSKKYQFQKKRNTFLVIREIHKKSRRWPERLFGQAATPSLASPFPFLDPRLFSFYRFSRCMFCLSVG